MRQARKGGKSGREAISKVEKSTTKRYTNHANPSSITKVTRFNAVGNNSKLAPLCLRIPTDQDRYNLLLFIC